MKSETSTQVMVRQGTLLKASAEVPESLSASAVPRLGGFALISTLGFLLTLVIDITSRGIAGPPRKEDVILTAVGAALSAVMFLACRVFRSRTQLLMDLGLAYVATIALIISLAETLSDREPGDPVWGISWVCLLIVLFPILVPHRRVPSIIVGAAAAGTGPLTYMVVSPFQARSVQVSDLIDLFSPNLIALILSIALIILMEKLGKELARARELGSYQMIERIGSGSMGEVWKAEHKWLARPAAIKLISPERLGFGGKTNSVVHDRFRREAEATASLSSPHTVTLYDYGIADSSFPYYAMELLDGIDLQTFVDTFGFMRQERAAFVIRQICLSLMEAHALGLVHRDIKPANVYLSRKGSQCDFVKVLDFGLVKPMGEVDQTMTQDSVLTGTPAYMAPEVASEQSYTPLSDIYALGCLAYTLLCGEPVFGRGSPLDVISCHLHKEPAPPSIPEEEPLNDSLVMLVMDCLKKVPDERPSNCRRIVERLDDLCWKDPWTEHKAEIWWESHIPVSGEPVP